MITAIYTVTWEDAVQGFVLHKQAVRTQRTALFYKFYLANLVQWVDELQIPLESFTKRHLDAYLDFRAKQGKKPTTREHDAVAIKTFFKWAKRNDYLDRDPLADYQVLKAPKPPVYLPTAEELQRLLKATAEFYSAEDNDGAKFCPAEKRHFHQALKYAVLMTQLDTACRIGEILNFKLRDYNTNDGKKQLVVRESKGKEERFQPVSQACALAIDD